MEEKKTTENDSPKLLTKLQELGSYALIIELFRYIKEIISLLNVPKNFYNGIEFIRGNIKYTLILLSVFGMILFGIWVSKYVSKVNSKKKLNEKVKPNLENNSDQIIETDKKEIPKEIERNENENQERLNDDSTEPVPRKRKKILLQIGMALFILLSIGSIGFISYLVDKEFYYVQIDSASTNKIAVDKINKYNEEFKENGENYLHARALQTKQNTYMITIRRGFFSKDYAEDILEKAESILDENSNDNRIYKTDGISIRKKIQYILLN